MKRQKQITDTLVFVFLALGSIVMLYPFIWMIFTSFKPKMHIYLAGLLPRTWDFSSYIQIWDEIPLVRGFLTPSCTRYRRFYRFFGMAGALLHLQNKL